MERSPAALGVGFGIAGEPDAGAILGIAFDHTSLVGSDIPVCPAGTTYGSTLLRGMYLGGFSISGPTLSYKLFKDDMHFDTVQFRVVTEPVPAPGPLVLLAAGAVTAERRRRG